MTSQDNVPALSPPTSDESPNSDERESSKDGRQWTSAGVFALLGFDNEKHLVS
ncbi:hypothetical protein E4U59_001408 [Claviceps monticola]|nr:hypothetical protein E4U59_001408 [Claviceps monticola]